MKGVKDGLRRRVYTCMQTRQTSTTTPDPRIHVCLASDRNGEEVDEEQEKSLEEDRCS